MRQVGATRINEIDARQVVLGRDLLRPQMLFDGQREICPAFDSRIIRDDQHLAVGDAADAGNDAGARRFAVVKTVGGQRSNLQERRPGGSRRCAIRSRGSSLPRCLCLVRAVSGPPSAASAVRARRRSAKARLCAAKTGERDEAEVSLSIVSHHACPSSPRRDRSRFNGREKSYPEARYRDRMPGPYSQSRGWHPRSCRDPSRCRA